MSALPTPNTSAASIWGRIVAPERGSLSPDAARALLQLDFRPEDRQRVDQLSARAADGTLTEAERTELEEYLRVNEQLMVLHSKARLSLKLAGLSPR